jgi:hypothetical protein
LSSEIIVLSTQYQKGSRAICRKKADKCTPIIGIVLPDIRIPAAENSPYAGHSWYQTFPGSMCPYLTMKPVGSDKRTNTSWLFGSKPPITMGISHSETTKTHNCTNSSFPWLSFETHRIAEAIVRIPRATKKVIGKLLISP